MADWGNSGASWGNGPATTAATDDWTGGSSGGAAGWDDGAANNAADSFNESSTPAADFGGSDDNGGGQGRPQGGCFNCGQDGHNKADCPNPRVERPFSGTCRTCNQEGHRASECPNKPKYCRNCHAENDHDTMECKNNKVIDNSNVPEMTETEAWHALKTASDDYDIDDFKEGLKALSKANPKITYLEIEQELRKRHFNVYLIGMKKEIAAAYTNVNLQGETGKTFTLGVFLRSEKCPRPILMVAWPKTPEDNLARLSDTGVTMESGIQVCGNCGKPGHTRKACDQERELVDAVKISCVLCDQEGHRARDCPDERPQRKERAPMTCRVCNSEEHKAADCPDKPKQICNNCGEEGHRKSDCTNERVPKCRNCDGFGHYAKECPEEKNWDKVTCRHCGETGHASETRCDPEKKKAFQEKQAAEEGGDAGGFDTAGFESSNTGGGEEWNTGNNDFGSGGADWENTVQTSAPAVTAGG